MVFRNEVWGAELLNQLIWTDGRAVGSEIENPSIAGKNDVISKVSILNTFPHRYRKGIWCAWCYCIWFHWKARRRITCSCSKTEKWTVYINWGYVYCRNGCSIQIRCYEVSHSILTQVSAFDNGDSQLYPPIQEEKRLDVLIVLIILKDISSLYTLLPFLNNLLN